MQHKNKLRSCLSVCCVSHPLTFLSSPLSLSLPFSIFQLAQKKNQKKGGKRKEGKKKERNRVDRTRCDTTFRERASAPTTTFVHAPTQSHCYDNVLERTNNQASTPRNENKRKKKGRNRLRHQRTFSGGRRGSQRPRSSNLGFHDDIEGQ